MFSIRSQVIEKSLYNKKHKTKQHNQSKQTACRDLLCIVLQRVTIWGQFKTMFKSHLSRWTANIAVQKLCAKVITGYRGLKQDPEGRRKEGSLSDTGEWHKQRHRGGNELTNQPRHALSGEGRVWLRVCWDIELRERPDPTTEGLKSQTEELRLSWGKMGPP